MPKHPSSIEPRTRLTARLVFPLLALTALALAGCRGKGAPTGGENPSKPGPAKVVASSARAAEILSELRARFPGVYSADAGDELAGKESVALLGPGLIEALAAVPEGLQPRFSASGPPLSARVLVPTRLLAPLSLEDAATGARIEVLLQDARDVAAETAEGYVVYPLAHISGATVLHRPMPNGIEDFLSFEERPSVPAITYKITLQQGVSGLRLVASTLEMLDDGGAPRLRVTPPFVVGADGVRTEAELAIAGCAVDTNPAAPWGRPVTAPGARTCNVEVRWPGDAVVYPALVDPVWATTGSLGTARQAHTATLITTTGTPAFNKVLVAGGLNTSGTAIAAAELYDPATGTWSATGSMTGARQLHGAVQLNASSNTTTSGKVLVAGGRSGTTTLNTAQLYSPSAGTWVAATNLNTAREQASATLLANGRVLYAGGVSGSGTISSAAVYDPSTGSGTWTATGAMGGARKAHTAKLLSTTNTSLNNKVIVVGGNNGSTSITSSPIQLFDGTSSWSTLTTPTGWTAREGQTATLLANSQVLIAGGKTVTSSSTTILASAWLFNPASGNGSWSQTGAMTAPRQQHTATLLSSTILNNGQVLVAGGSNSTTATLGSAELFNGSTWALTSALAAPTKAYTANLVSSGKVLIAGGLNGTTTVGAAELYDPSRALACTSNAQCATGFCASGVCCNTSCTNECSACNLTGLVGTCSSKASGTACTDEGNPCTLDQCNGAGTCGHTQPGNAGTVCHQAAGECDTQKTCTGTSTTCPNSFKPSGTACTDDGNLCTLDQCNGAGTCGHTQPGNAGTVCHQAAGECDTQKTCSGTSTSCPNSFIPSGTACTDDGNLCTLDQCDGAGTCSHTPQTCDPAPGTPTLTFRMRSVTMPQTVTGLFEFNGFATRIGTTDIATDHIFECNDIGDGFLAGPCVPGVTWYYPNDLNGSCGPPLSTCVANINRFPESRWKHTAVLAAGPVGSIPITVSMSPGGANPSGLQFHLTVTRDASGAAVVTPDGSPQSGISSLSSTCATTNTGFVLCWSVDFGEVTPPPLPLSIDFPMNIESDTVDPNNLPLDPRWRIQGGGAVDQRGTRATCGQFSITNGSLSVGDPPCTNQAIYTNLVGDFARTNPPLPTGICDPTAPFSGCLCIDELFQGVNGHVNWPSRVTVQGLLGFDGWETDFGHDWDFNINITPRDQGLLMLNHTTLLIEFNSEETIHNYNGPGWLDYYDNQHIVDGHEGIVTGVVGIDAVHGPEGTEIHPGLAMSVNLTSGDQCGPFGPGFMCKAALANAAGLFQESTDDLDRELASGQSVSQLATQKGVSQSDLLNALGTGASNGQAQDICGAGKILVCDNICEPPSPCVKPKCTCEPRPLPPPTLAQQFVGFHHVHNVDRYAVFARTTGNEGACSSNDETLDLPNGVYSVRYPWKGPKGVAVTPVFNTEMGIRAGLGLVLQIPGGVRDFSFVQDQSILVNYNFFPGAISMDGDVIFVYGSGPVFDLHRQYTSQGDWGDTAKFLSADFTGDGLPDTAYMFDDNGNISIDIHVNNGDGTLTLHRWTTRAGGWEDAAKFLVSDFDGDGRNDIAYVFQEAGLLSVDVYINLGSNNLGEGSFRQESWQHRDGGWLDGARLLAADFTGDGHPDIAFAFNANGLLDIDVHANGCTTGPATCTRRFEQHQRWSSNLGAWLDTATFLPGDFTGDGRPDIAFAFNQDDFISIDVHPNTGLCGATCDGNGFGAQQPWAVQSGGWLDSAQFMPGDFDGDGRLDVAYAFREQHDNLVGPLLSSRSVPPTISIDIHRNLGSTPGAFGPPERWSRAFGGWPDAIHFMQGDFDGDGALDIADAFNCDGKICQDLHRNLDGPPVPTYSLVDLGMVASSTPFPGTVQSDYATGINSVGVTVGYVITASPYTVHGFRYSPSPSGIMTDIGASSLAGPFNFATAINDSGRIAMALDRSGGGGGYIPGIFDPSAPPGTDPIKPYPLIAAPSPYQSVGGAAATSYSTSGIDSAGNVVGEAANSQDPSNVISVPFYSDGTTTVSLGSLGGTRGGARAVNDLGSQIVGYSQTPSSPVPQQQFNMGHAFVYNVSTGMHDLNTMIPAGSGWELRMASGVNNSGQIVGYGQYTDPVTHSAQIRAYRFSNGSVLDLGVLPGGGLPEPEAINSRGVVVGHDIYGAWIYIKGVGMKKLDDLLLPSDFQNWRLVYATGINDTGQIAAYGCPRQGNCIWRAFLLRP